MTLPLERLYYRLNPKNVVSKVSLVINHIDHLPQAYISNEVEKENHEGHEVRHEEHEVEE